MASINKLSIRGVRSFSPDDDEQVIEFFFPVTMIVGANGCGKTTVIESLKYAVTGSLPPGKNPGQSFVHDPKAVGQSVVKANVKLRFTNRAGSSMVLVRSMELTQRKTTLSFKALDGVLRTIDPKTGERISMSHKCTELDRQIPVLLGVSKPILEHVVFCHQEESSWPLMDSAVLKKRFDDIFDSTRYTKALKNLQEIRKDHQSKAKDLKADLNGLASHKHAAKGFRQELEQQQSELELLEEQVEEHKKQIKDVEEVMSEKNDIISRIEDIKSEMEECRGELEKEQSVLAKQISMLEEDLTERHTRRELKDMLRDFDEQVSQQQEKMADLQRDHDGFKKGIESINKEEVILSGQIGRLKAEQEAYDQLVTQRLAKMEELAQGYGIDLRVTQSQPTATQVSSASHSLSESSQDSTITVSDDDLNAFRKALEAKDAEIRRNLKEHKDRAEREQDSLSNSLSDLVSKQKSLENERHKNSAEQQEARKELQTLNSRAAGHSRIRQSDINDAKRRAAEFVQRRDEATSNPRKTEIPIEIRSLDEKIDKLKREIEDDQQCVQDMRLSSDAQNEISVLKDQVIKETERLEEIIQENSFEMQKFGLKGPGKLQTDVGEDKGEDMILELEKLADSIKEKFEMSHQRHARTGDELRAKQRSVAEENALLQHNRSSLTTAKAKAEALTGDSGSIDRFHRIVKEIRQFETERGKNSTVDDSDPQKVVSYVISRLEDLDEDSSEPDPKVVKVVLKRLGNLANAAKRMEGGKPVFPCPCCQRGMTTTEELQIFTDSIKELANEQISPIMKDKDKIEQTRATKEKYQRWRKAVSQCSNDVVDHKRIVSEIATLEEAIAGLESSLKVKRCEVDELNSELVELASETNDLRDLTEVSKRWVDDANRIATKKFRIGQKTQDLSMSMTGVNSTKDLRTVERQLEDKREEKDRLMTKIQKLNKEFATLNQLIAQLTQQANTTEQLAREREAKFATEQEANSRKALLNETVRKCAEEEKRLQDLLLALRPKIRAKETDKQKHREFAKSEEERHTSCLSKFSSDVNAFESLSTQIERYSKSRERENLVSLTEKLAKLRDKLEEKEKRLKDLEPELERISRNMNDHGRHKALITENISVFQGKQRIVDLEKDIKRHLENLEQVEGYDTCEADYDSASHKRRQLQEQTARLEGRRGGFVDQIRILKRKLMTEEYKNIDERHREMMIRHETTTIVVSDLEKYHNALDQALLRYHGVKIQEINKIIRELWTLTYKGEDITNIELVSGQEKGSRASRSYNYRVVMSKGGTQLDMRGRCSAGQRVLASIVIRLALAETFCVNCGCIALDEPTVNLDYHNKRGLALALAQIISARAQQSNFQLLVITHDEEFVSMMKTELSTQTGFSMPEKYFQVRREEGVDGKYYSKINAVDWDELA